VRHALVTGGARGIGAMITKRLSDSGLDVTFTFNSSVSEAEGIQEDLRGQGRNCHSVQCDFRSEAAVQQLCEEIMKRPEGHSFDVVVCNAGCTYDSLVSVASPERVAELFHVNVLSQVQVVSAALRQMQRKRFGRVLMLGSTAARRGAAGNALYAATKSALEGFAKGLAVEVGRRGITVNCIAPGFVDTDMVAKYESQKESLVGLIPANRYGDPDEVAKLAVFLSGPDACYVNGETITIDGGFAVAALTARSRGN